MAVTIACCLWNEWPEAGWEGEYVARLARGVERNLKIPYRFVCLTDEPEKVPSEIETIPLKPLSRKGCLPKIMVYNPENGFKGRVLLLDLDNVITGDLTEIASYSGPLAVRANFQKFDRGKVEPDGDIIGFRAGFPQATKLWENFSNNPIKAANDTRGRERFFIRSVVKPKVWQGILGPLAILSYKNHFSKGQTLSKETCIVSFHDGGTVGGAFRPHKLGIPWLKTHWY